MGSTLSVYSTSNKDYEFIGFSFSERHCSEFNLTVVSPNSSYTESLFAEFEDKSLTVEGKTGSYYFGTKINNKPINIELAFDNLTSQNLKDIKSWLSPKTTGKLIFDASPYKYYYVKLSSSPSFSFVPFEEVIEVGGVTTRTHIFKGTLSISFISYDPYGYSDYCRIYDVPIWNGTTMVYHSYSWTNIPGWLLESGLYVTKPNDLVTANASAGFTIASISIGDIPYTFYNGGTIDAPLTFVLTVAAFNIADDPLTIINVTSSESFTLESLKNIPALSSNTGPWTITCNSSTGSITTTINSVIYNLGSLHNGTFLTILPGENILSTNKALTDVNFKHKYIYW